MNKLICLALLLTVVAVAMAVLEVPKPVEVTAGGGIPARRCKRAGQYIRDLSNCEYFFQCDAGLVPQRFHCDPNGQLCWNQPTLQCQWKDQSSCRCW